MRLFKLNETPDVNVPFVPPHLIQIKASGEEIDRRIQKYIERKREEINQSNIRDFCARDSGEVLEGTCARVDAKLAKRKDSKGHLQVSRVLNPYYRDQGDFEYMKSYNAKNGIEERMRNCEIQLSITSPVNKGIYQRLRNVEDRLLHLESISPEYVQFWDKNVYFQRANNKKRVFTMDEIDSFINHLEKKKAKISSQSDEDT